MSILNYTDSLGLRNYADLDSAWGTGVRLNNTVIDRAITPQNVYFVSPSFTSDNLQNTNASARKHFDTIQGAITAFETAQSSEQQHGAIIVYPGTYNERLNITKGVGLFAAANNPFQIANGAWKPIIAGNGTSAATINFSPISNKSASLVISGIELINKHANNSGADHDGPSLIQTSYQGTNASTSIPGTNGWSTFTNRIQLHNVTCREILYGSKGWLNTFKINPWIRLCINDSYLRLNSGTQMLSMWFSGSSSNLPASIWLNNCDLEMTPSGGISRTIYCANYTYGNVGNNRFLRDRAHVVAFQGANNNVIGLMDDAQAEQYRNSFGFVMSNW